MSEHSAEIVVVGGGIVGASVASALSETHCVALLEAESQPGYHATGRSAALFTETYGPAHIRALTRASRHFFDEPPEGFAQGRLLHSRGTLFVGSELQRNEMAELHRKLAAEGGRSRLLSPDEACSWVPVLRPEAAATALLDPDAFDIEVDALLQGFLKKVRHHGSLWSTGTKVRRLNFDRGHWAVETESGDRWRAPTIINAAGAWADTVAELAGVRPIGIEPRRRSAFTFAPPEGMSFQNWPAVVALDESWYFKPEAGLLLGSPANADPVAPHDVVAEELDIAIGIHHIEQATRLQIRRPKHTWAGLRSFVADGEPVCGFASDAPGFFWAAAVGGYGIQTSPAFGRLCAAMVRGDPVPDDIAAQGLLVPAVSAARLA